MHATHSIRRDNVEATKHALIGKKLQVTVGGNRYTGTCDDVVAPAPNRPADDVLVRVDSCEDYSREWKILDDA